MLAKHCISSNKKKGIYLLILYVFFLLDYVVSTKEWFCFVYLVECLFESSNWVHMEQATWTCACAYAGAGSVACAGAGVGAGAGALPWWPRCQGWWLSRCWCPPPRSSPPPATQGQAWLPLACYCPGPATAQPAHPQAGRQSGGQSHGPGWGCSRWHFSDTSHWRGLNTEHCSS